MPKPKFATSFSGFHIIYCELVYEEKKNAWSHQIKFDYYNSLLLYYQILVLLCCSIIFRRYLFLLNNVVILLIIPLRENY